MMWWHGMPWGSWSWLGGLAMMFGGFLFVALLIGLVVWLANSGRRAPVYAGSAAPRSAALDIVRERYARGEIDREEYQRLQDDLRT